MKADYPSNVLTATGYASLVATPFAVLFFSNLPIYGAIFLWPLQPLHFLALLAAATFPLLLGDKALALDFRSPFVLWCSAYLFLCMVWFSLFGAWAIGPVTDRVLAILVAVAAYTLFRSSPLVRLRVRYGILVCVLLGAAINFYDITHPFALTPATSEFATVGRADGLYLNPNLSAAALLLGLLLTIDICRPGLRPAYVLIVFAAVMLTVSRGAMVGMVLIVMAWLYAGTLRMRQLVGMAIVGVFVGYLGFRFLAPSISALQVDWSLLLTRLDWLADLGSNADFSQRERIMLAEKAWALFINNPLVGAGLGSTELWDARSSTHNMYLAAMADFGLVGIFVFPALVSASVGGMAGLINRRYLAFTGFVLWWGMVSHNIIGEFYFMISLSLMAAIAESELAERRLSVSGSSQAPSRSVASGLVP